MDFNFNPEDEAFRMEFREWLDANKQFAPNVGETAGGMAEGRGAFEQQQAWAKKMAEGRWLAPSWPEKYGGRGAGILQNIVYDEELARAGVPAPMIGMGISLFGPTLLHWGTEEQKQRFIPPIMKAEEIWCQGYSEPGSGSDLASLQTRAVEDGDYFVVNGQKVWTSIAQHADWIFLLVRTDPDAPKHKGISYLMVDMHSPGVTVRPLVQMTGDKGFNEVFFEDVRVPKKNLVGEKNSGMAGRHHDADVRALGRRRRSRRHGAGARAGEAREISCRATARRRGTTRACGRRSRSSPARRVALRYTGYRQLTRRLKGMPPGPEGSMMKLCGTELNLRIQLFAMELLGPYSQMEYKAPFAVDKGKWSFRMLAARGGTIAAGSNQIQHNIIGERVLGLPKG